MTRMNSYLVPCSLQIEHDGTSFRKRSRKAGIPSAADGHLFSPRGFTTIDVKPLDRVDAFFQHNRKWINCLARLQNKIFLARVCQHETSGCQLRARFHPEEIHLLCVTQCVTHRVASCFEGTILSCCRVRRVNTPNDAEVHQD